MVMVTINLLKILCRMRLRKLMMIIMLRDMTMHMLKGGADENDDMERWCILEYDTFLTGSTAG